DPSHRKGAAKKLNQAAQSYERLLDTMKNVHSARVAHQQALVRLPGYLLWLTARNEADTAQDSEWADAHKKMASLMDRFAAGDLPQNPQDISGDALLRDMANLERRQQQMVEELTKTDKDRGAEAVAVIDALRAGGGLNVDQRVRLWQTARELA